MERPARLVFVVVLLLGLVALDQGSKEIAIRVLKGRPAIAFPPSWYPNDLFSFRFATNKGAFLSFGSGFPDWVLTWLNALILAGVSLYVVLKRRMAAPVVVSLTLILAGGFGNLIDRLFRGGEVVDFMNMGIRIAGKALRTGIFNVADLAIVGGLLLLLALELFASKQDKGDRPGSGAST